MNTNKCILYNYIGPYKRHFTYILRIRIDFYRVLFCIMKSPYSSYISEKGKKMRKNQPFKVKIKNRALKDKKGEKSKKNQSVLKWHWKLEDENLKRSIMGSQWAHQMGKLEHKIW